MSIVMRSGMATVISVVFKEIVVHWIVVGIMMSTMFWEVMVIMVISVSFPTSSMVIMMSWVMIIMDIMVLSISIVMVG